MKRLLKKLHSQRGASLLLALLMLLVCVMVGSSVLAAAASNAGKAKSNQVEQQKYLTLSSAIQLIADELAQAKYIGKYQLWEWEVTTEVTDDTDPASPVTTTTVESFFYCKQSEGEYSCGDLTLRLPLGRELDEIFSRQFTDKGSGCQALDSTELESSKVRTLTVTLPDNLGGYPGSGPPQYQASTAVTVQVKLDHATKHIRLTAWEGTGDLPADPSDPTGATPDKSKTMQAELVVKKDSAPVLDYNPSGRKPLPSGETPPAGDSTITSGNTTIETKVEKNGEETSAAGAPMEWELNWIKKGAA